MSTYRFGLTVKFDGPWIQQVEEDRIDMLNQKTYTSLTIVDLTCSLSNLNIFHIFVITNQALHKI